MQFVHACTVQDRSAALQQCGDTVANCLMQTAMQIRTRITCQETLTRCTPVWCHQLLVLCMSQCDHHRRAVTLDHGWKVGRNLNASAAIHRNICLLATMIGAWFIDGIHFDTQPLKGAPSRSHCNRTNPKWLTTVRILPYIRSTPRLHRNGAA